MSLPRLKGDDTPDVQSREKIAIIGMSFRFPGADHPDDFWANLQGDVDSVVEIPRDRWRWEEVYGDPQKEANKSNSRWGGFIDGIDQFDPLFFKMSPTEANFVDPQHRIFLETAWRAIEDAGYRTKDLSGRSIGVYAGVSKNDYAEMLGQDLPSFVSTGTVHSILVNRLSFLLNLSGPSIPIDTACSSSLVALHYAVRDLRDGACEAAIVGGVNALLSPRMYLTHAKSGMLSSTGRCRTFDADADGYVRGEGVGVVFLKPLGRARADGDHIYGIIAATAINHGGRANFLTAPNVTAQREVVLQAHRAAGIDPRSVRYIQTHGTGTPLGDPIEIEALKQAFATRLAETGAVADAPYCALGSVKTYIGHLESAAGMASLIEALLVLKHRRAPGLLHFRTLNPHIDLAGSPFFLADGGPHPGAGDHMPWVAGVSAFGMGGVNAHVLLQEPPPPPLIEPVGRPLPFLFSARKGRLRALISAQRDFLQTPVGAAARPEDIAHTLALGRDAFEERGAVVAQSVSELKERLTAFLGAARPIDEVEANDHAPDAVAAARAWLDGGEATFDRFVPAGRRISLPGYPFAHRSCWFTGRPPVGSADRPHSLSSQAVFEISGDDLLLRDHRVQGVRHLPAAGFLRLIADRVAGKGPVEISDTYWLQPFVVEGVPPRALTLSVESDGLFQFNSSVLHCRGVALPTTAGSGLVAIDKALARCPETVSGDAVYVRLAGHGLDYGPTFRVLERAHLGAMEAVGVVKRFGADAAGALWDAAMQTAALLSLHTGANASQFVPFHTDSFFRYADMALIELIHVRQRETREGASLIAFDIDCVRRDGTPVAQFRNFSKRAYVLSERSQGAPSRGGATSPTLLYRSDWRVSEPVDPREGKSPIAPVLVGAPDALADALAAPGGGGPTRLSSDAAAIEREAQVVFSVPDWEHRPWLIFASEPGEADLLMLLRLAQLLMSARPRRPLRLKYVGRLDSAGPAAAAFRAASGFARTLGLEYPSLQLDVVGFRDSWSAADLLAESLQETSTHHAVEWRDGARHEVAIVEVAPPVPATLPLRRGGVCLLSGGSGGLGRALALALAEMCQSRVVIIGRRPADARIDEQIAELKALGGDAVYLQADCADGVAVAEVVKEARRSFGAVHGVVHAVGCIEDSFILRKDAESFTRVLRPKMAGALHLDEATSGDPLDLFLCVSSVAALMPNQGQCDYASANAFLDQFMAERAQLVGEGRRQGLSLSLNLPLLAEGGIRVGPRETAYLAREFGMLPLPMGAAIDLFRCAATLAATDGVTQLLGIAGDRTKIERHLRVGPHIRVGKEAADAPALDLAALVQRDLRILLARQFGRPPASVTPDCSLRDLGMDSLAVATLTDRLDELFGVQLKPMLFFQEDQPRGVATELLARHYAAIAGAYARLGPLASFHRTYALIDPERGDPGAGDFLRRVTNREFYMVDHIVDGLFNVPGACFLEMARQAGAWRRFDAPVVRMTDNLWARRLSSDGPAFDVEVTLRDIDASRARYEISSIDPAGARAVYAAGILEFGAVRGTAATLPLAAIRSRCADRRSREEVYRQIHAEGLHVGPSFMPMVDIVLSETEALATLRLPETAAAAWSDYLLHPTLLTGVFQTALINNRAREKSGRQFIPVAVGSLEIHGVPPMECVVHSVRRLGPAGGDLVKFDIHVADTQGHAVLTLREFTIMAREASTIVPDAAPDRGERQAAAERFLQEILAPIIGLGPEEIEPSTPFRDYGVTSLIILDLNRRMEEVFGAGLSRTLFFEYRNLGELAGYFLEHHAAVLPALECSGPAQAPRDSRLDIDTGVVEPDDAARRFLQEILAPVIGLEPKEIDPTAPFRDYGVTSLMILDLNRRMEEVFGAGLSRTLFFEYLNLDELAGYFLEHHPEALPVRRAPPDASRLAAPNRRASPKAPDSSVAVESRGRSDADDAVAIVGLALRFPEADNAAAFWRLLAEGRDCIRRAPPERAALEGAAPPGAPYGGYIDGVELFDAEFFSITPREAALIDPQERLLLQVAWHALEDAGVTRAALAQRRVGVFIGALWQPYLELGVQARATGRAVAPSSLLYSIANRISYFCNFTGPSLAVDTACSSSLTALHLAVQSLALGESDVALAGGVNLSLGASKHLFLSHNNFLSEDGRCRSFGAGGSGYVPGEGAGVLVLQKLAAARAAGRRVYGVIRSTTVNHGGRTNGYTVPNPGAQSALIREAINKARVDARALSYLEAHGTGTELGDPIEIAGLTNAFRQWTPDRGFCAIGSVKSNFGHLEAAAGVAGLIKVLLQMLHGSLAPSLHAATTNPHIDFSQTPFIVQQRLAPWTRPILDGKEAPRRGGVSSFGAGGSNAHVIVEEFIAETAYPPSGRRVIAPISARTQERLRALAGNLSRALAEPSDDGIDSIAYTLQVGREAFEHREAFVIASVEELRACLDAFVAQAPARTPSTAGNVANPLFKLLQRDGELSRLAANWAAQGADEKLADAWKLGIDVDWAALWPSPPGFVSLPGYPFAPDRHWLTDGTEPDVGSSLDAAAVIDVAARRLSAPTPLGESVELPRGRRYRLRFSGEEPFFADHVVGGRRTLPAAGYLALAQAAAAEIAPTDGRPAMELTDVVWSRPCIVETTGVTVVLDIERTEADEGVFAFRADGAEAPTIYCTGALRWRRVDPMPSRPLADLTGTLKKGQPGSASYDRFREFGLDYGPTHRGILETHVAGANVMARLDPVTADHAPGLVSPPGLLDSALQLALIARLNAGDHDAPPLPFALAGATFRGPLRNAAFASARPAGQDPDRDGVDIDVLASTGETLLSLRGFRLRHPGGASGDDVPNRLDAALMLPCWRALVAAPPVLDAGRCAKQKLLVIGDAPDEAVSRLAASFASVHRHALGELPPGAAHAVGHLLFWLPEVPSPQGGSGWEGSRLTFQLLKSALRDGLGSLSVEWTVVIPCLASLPAAVAPDIAACEALFRVAAAEHPSWAMRIVEIVGDAASPDQLAHLQADLTAPVWRLDGGEYFQEQIVPINTRGAVNAAESLWRQNGVYFVIGGAGGIGVAWSERAIRTLQAQIIWIGRKPMSDGIQAEIDRLGALGPAPIYMQADATDAEALARARNAAVARFGRINGLIHTAIVLDDASLDTMDIAQFDRVMAAKAETCRAMELVFQKEPPELLVFFSSINAFAAPVGQSNYAAASRFADYFARRLASRWGSATKTINWGFWGSVGIVAESRYRDSLFRRGFGSIEPEAGFRALDVLLGGPFDQLVFVPTQPGDEAARRFFASGSAGPVVLDQIATLDATAKPQLDGVVAALGDFERRDAAAIADAASDILGVPVADIDPTIKFVDYGLDAGALAALQSRLRALRPKSGETPELTGETTLASLFASVGADTPSSDRDVVAVERLIRQLVRTALADAGLWETAPAMAPPHLRRWHEETRRLLAEIPAGEAATLGVEWTAFTEKPGVPETVTSRLDAYLGLFGLTLPALADLLRGERRPTDVLFPKGSLREVERVYRFNDVAQRLNRRLAAVALGHLAAHRREFPDRPYRIVELGAGTGATTEIVLEAFEAANVAPDDYFFTDLSPAFLTSAQDRYARRRPYLSYRVFDVEADVWSQSTLQPGSFDLVIATNVLHATRRVRTAIETVKGLLQPRGALLLHELTRADFLNHMTFGLLAGWWDFADARRLPGSPLLSEQGWRDLLAQSGFDRVYRIGRDDPDPGQAVFAAQSEGFVVRPLSKREGPAASVVVPEAISVADPAARAPDAPAPDAEATLERVRDAVARVTRIPRKQLRDDDTFESYGVDSIVRLTLQADLERSFGPLPKTLLFEWPSIAEAADVIARRLAAVAPPVRPAQPAHPKPSIVSATAGQIAIIGMSGRYPRARTLDVLWRRLVAGESCITETPPDRRGAPVDGAASYGGFLEDVDRFDHALFRLSREDAAALSPEARQFLEIAWLAFENGGYGLVRLKHWRRSSSAGVGVFVASMYGQGASSDPTVVDENLTEWMIANRTSHFFDIDGPSLTINSACSGALTAVHLACESLRGGDCAMALAGGVNLTLRETKFDTLRRLGFLGSGDASRSFGQGDGFLPGEGVGAVLLKPLDRAISEGDRIDAVIRGSAISHAGGRQSFFAPERKAQTHVMRESLRRAAIEPGSITYVEASANGLEMADALEVAAIAEALGTAGREAPCAVGSVKSNLGHLEAASGMSQIAKAVLQMQRQTLIPSLFATPSNPHVDFASAKLSVQQNVAPWTIAVGPAGESWPRRCLINSFGAGGAYAAMALEEYPPPPLPSDTGPALLLVSAADAENLRRRLAQLRDWLESDGGGEALSAVAATLAAVDSGARERTAILAASHAGVAIALGEALSTGSPSGLFVSDVDPDAAPDLRRTAVDWLSGAPQAFTPAGPPVRLPPYPFDHSARFPLRAESLAPIDAYDAAISKIRAGDMTEAEFITLMQS